MGVPEPDRPVWARPPAPEKLQKPAERKPSVVARGIRSAVATWSGFPATMSRFSAGSSKNGSNGKHRPAAGGSLPALSANGQKSADAQWSPGPAGFARGTAHYAVKRAN